MEPFEFNFLNCGIGLHLVEGIGLATTGIVDCVVLQVLSNEYIFAAHITTYDSRDNNLRAFCNEVRGNFVRRGSRIRECALWYTSRLDSFFHALHIIDSVSQYFDVTTELKKSPGRSSLKLTYSGGIIYADEVGNWMELQRVEKQYPDHMESEANWRRESYIEELLVDYNGFAAALKRRVRRKVFFNSDDGYYADDEFA